MLLAYKILPAGDSSKEKKPAEITDKFHCNQWMAKKTSVTVHSAAASVPVTCAYLFIP
jgi:hypothetical protein